MDDMERAERVFIMADGRYSVPDISALNMAERRVMYELCGFGQEDFVQDVGESESDHLERVAKMTKHPGFMESLMHIAYQRGHPELRRDKVQTVVDKVVFSDAVAEWADDLEETDADDPPALTTAPEQSSPNGHSASSKTSGDTSPIGSDPPGRNLASTGTG